MDGTPTIAGGGRRSTFLASLAASMAIGLLTLPVAANGGATRFATFNASLNRGTADAALADLSTPDDEQAQNVAAIIQRVRPEVLLLNEFDYEPDGALVDAFQSNYLAVSQGADLEPISYEYSYVAPSNTGVASGFDLNNDGAIVIVVNEPGYGDDAFGFGAFPGQYGMAVLSQHPIDEASVRTFAEFRWQDMPDAALPDDPTTVTPGDWYDQDELSIFRLSSKSHWDVPIDIDGNIVHFLVSHPTPPTFDGPEDRNGLRNHDEIRFWADYISGGDSAAYIYDDGGGRGGLEEGAAFVIAGDQNADPVDGDSTDHAILALLDHPLVNATVVPMSAGGAEQSKLQSGANAQHLGDPAADTADFQDINDSNSAPGNLRVDYVLPASTLEIADAGVYWPLSTDPDFGRVGVFDPGTSSFPSSDHRLVWVDVVTGG